MKNIIAEVLVLSFLGVSQGDLLARQRYGAQILVYKKNGQRIEGELMAVKQKLLLIMDWIQHKDYAVEIEEIKSVDIVKKNYAFGTSRIVGILVNKIKVERRSEEEIDLILEKLRKKARDPDYS